MPHAARDSSPGVEHAPDKTTIVLLEEERPDDLASGSQHDM